MTAGTPRAVISLTVEAPARQITRSAARHHLGHVVDIGSACRAAGRCRYCCAAGSLLHERPSRSSRRRGCGGRAGRPQSRGSKKSEHLLIHAARAETAPEGRDERTLIRQAELLARLRPREREEVPAHGRTRDDDLLRVLIVLAALLKAHHDARRHSPRASSSSAPAPCSTRVRPWGCRAARRIS